MYVKLTLLRFLKIINSYNLFIVLYFVSDKVEYDFNILV